MAMPLLSHVEYVSLHEALYDAGGAVDARDTLSTFSNDRDGLAKHTPTLTMDFTNVEYSGVTLTLEEVTITVRHASTEGHFIEAIYAMDENGNQCGGCSYPQPDDTGDQDTTESVCTFTKDASACGGAQITAYEYCNLHGSWKGSDVLIADWASWDTYVAEHNAFMTGEAMTYVANTPSSFDDDRKPLAKHTPVVTMTDGVATITVNHGSADGHFIQGVGYFDQNGEIYLTTFEMPDDSGEQDNTAQVAEFTLPAHVTTVTPYESCDKHGIWQGQATTVADWASWDTYVAEHNAFMTGEAMTYVANTPSSHPDEAYTKHTPTSSVTASGTSVSIVVRHGSADGHFIQGVGYFDQNGEIYLKTFEMPDDSGEQDNTAQVVDFTLPDHVVTVTPYESCDKHGIWQGTTMNVDNWHLVYDYQNEHVAFMPYETTEFSGPGNETTTKHAPTIQPGADEGMAQVHVAHGSSEEHFIEATWAVDQNGELYGPFVDTAPDDTGDFDKDASMVDFAVHQNVEELQGFEYCNLHGLWYGDVTDFPITSTDAPTPPPTQAGRFPVGHDCFDCNACVPLLSNGAICDVTECEPCKLCFPGELPDTCWEDHIIAPDLTTEEGCEAVGASACFSPDGSFNENLGMGCDEAARACAPFYQPTEEDDEDDEDDMCDACGETCGDGDGKTCPSLETALSEGGCAYACMATQELLDGCIQEMYDDLSCDFDLASTDAPVTDAPVTDSSATATSPAFGLLVSIACVALMR